MNEEAYTVSELNNFIRDVIKSGFPQAVWISGEVQGYNRQKSKSHTFFQLIEKDAQSNSQKATIDLVIWSASKVHINKVLKSADEAFELSDDIEVKFLCRVDFYPPHGRVRLSVEDVDPYFTLGKLAQEKQKLIDQLRKEGALEKNKQLELASVPLELGLITSDDSAAYNDFISELERSNLGFKVHLRNSLMQGARAEKDVISAIDELSDIKSLDAIIITRGGGSLSDLNCFDSELIAKKMAACPLPVLSGIGHEINITITDLAAHTHAKTPTAIAQFLVHRVESFLGLLDEHMDVIVARANHLIETRKEQLKANAIALQSKTNQYLKDHNVYLIQLMEKIKTRPVERMKQRVASLDRVKENLLKSVHHRFHNEAQSLKSFKKIIDAYHPQRTLKRGFSITRDSAGKALKSASDVKSNTKIITELAKGKIESEVQRIKKE